MKLTEEQKSSTPLKDSQVVASFPRMCSIVLFEWFPTDWALEGPEKLEDQCLYPSCSKMCADLYEDYEVYRDGRVHSLSTQ